MLVKTFICEEHDDFGTLGWREKDKLHFQPLTGMAVAHDCLEHFPDDGPEIEYEIQALGAMMHVRGLTVNNGYRTYKCWENIQAEMPILFMLHQFQDVQFNQPPRTARLQAAPEDQIDQLMNSLRDFLIGEICDGPGLEARATTSIDNFVTRIRGWLRIGYRRATRRWRMDTAEIHRLFKDISSQADTKLKYAEIGDELEVRIDARKRTVKVRYDTYQDLYDLNKEEE